MATRRPLYEEPYIGEVKFGKDHYVLKEIRKCLDFDYIEYTEFTLEDSSTGEEVKMEYRLRSN